MKEIILKPLFHNKQGCIGIFLENYPSLNTILRKQVGAKWSQTNKCWYVPLSKENYNKLFFALKGKAVIEQSGLHQYLAGKKNKKVPLRQPVVKTPLLAKSGIQPIHQNSLANRQLPRKIGVIYKSVKIAPVNSHVLPAMRERLSLKAFSPSTIKTYINEMSQLLQTLNNIPADELKPEHLKRYLVYCYEKLKLTENTLHSRINAMKFYYEQVLGREKFFWEIPRPKKPLLLPKLLNEAELAKLFNALSNKKHKAMLFTAYSAGLRVSEIVTLKIADIDSKRMQILVQRGKGKRTGM